MRTVELGGHQRWLQEQDRGTAGVPPASGGHTASHLACKVLQRSAPARLKCPLRKLDIQVQVKPGVCGSQE